jgi:cobalt-zinc-cadmium efflux system protein
MANRNAFSDRIFSYREVESKKLIWALSITTLAMIVEVVGGLLTGSIALIGDAGHMFTHTFSIIISLGAIYIARNPPCHHRTFGLFRAEILAAFVNSLFLFGVSAVIAWESIERLIHPVPILGMEMFFVAVFGMAVNVTTMFIIHGHHKEDLNVRSVFLHMLADTASSAVIVVGAVLIHFTGFTLIDPLIGLGISLVIIAWTWGLLRESTRILLEMAPAGLDVDSMEKELKMEFPEIDELDKIHFWAITSNMYVFSAHLKVRREALEDAAANGVVDRVTRFLQERHPIVQSTIQLVDQPPRGGQTGGAAGSV